MMPVIIAVDGNDRIPVMAAFLATVSYVVSRDWIRTSNKKGEPKTCSACMSRLQFEPQHASFLPARTLRGASQKWEVSQVSSDD